MHGSFFFANSGSSYYDECNRNIDEVHPENCQDDDDGEQNFFLFSKNIEENLDESSSENDGLSFAPYVSPPRNTPERCDPIEPDFESAHLSQEAESLLRGNEEIMKCTSLREQIVLSVDLLRPTGKVNALATWEQLGKLFKLSRGAVASHYARGIENGDVGNIQLLKDEEINIMIEEIYKAYSNGTPMTYDDISFFIKERFDKEMQQSALYKLIQRISQLKSVEGEPMDSLRISCSCEDIDSYYDKLEAILQRKIPAPFVINIDESGCNEFADAMNTIVIVPSDFPHNEIKIPVKRCSKNTSIIGAICCDGSTITPGVVVNRKTIETELYEAGYTDDKVCIGHQENGFFNKDTFQEWAEKYFFPEIMKRREKYEYQGEALVILDGFCVHDTDWFLDECTFYNIIPLFMPPHSSDQCQPLDIGIFFLQKLKMQRIKVDDRYDPQTQKLIKMIDSLRQATTISNVIGAFRGAGIDVRYDGETNMLYPYVNRAMACKVRHWAYSQQKDFVKKRIKIE